MTTHPVASVSGNSLGMRPRNYGHLQGLAARYAQTRLHGRRIVNQATGYSIALDYSRGLKKAVATGTPPELLLMLPALPMMLAQAAYLGASWNLHQLHGDQRLHGFRICVDVTGRPINLWLVAREAGQGELRFDRIISRTPLIASMQDGGQLFDSPGVRSRALEAVLARAKIPRRQDGGAAEEPSADEEPPSSVPSPAQSELPAQVPAGPSPQAIRGDASDLARNTELALGGDECDEQYHDDLQICRNLPNRTEQDKGARSRCWGSAETRLWNCKQGKPIPPLVTWREAAPPSPQPWSKIPLPLIIPSPPSQGGGGGFLRSVPGLPLLR